ncbi:MAG TPA: hypothetical protein VHL11_23150, partial [Phototrophicaceae bacterium]|nr:hypothetical protein [Phototrophicaceae bacterium]
FSDAGKVSPDNSVTQSGDCAFQVKPGGKLSQIFTASDLTAGTTISFSAAVKSKNLMAGGKITVQFVYADGSQQQIRIALPTGTYADPNVAGSMQLSGNPVQVKVKVTYNGASGQFLIDNLKLASSGMGSNDGTIPLP